MSFKELTESGQPKNVYEHPKELPELIYRQLGVYIGFISFQHNFQGLTNLLMTLKLLRTIEDQDKFKVNKMLINLHTKQPIKTKINRDALDKLEQIWERGGYLYTKYVEVHETFTDVEYEEYRYSYPEEELSDLEEVIRVPSLFGLKPKDEVTSQSFLIRINEGVAERDAYRNQDPRWLCEQGHLEYEKNGVITPYFKTYEDILNSTYFTQEVPRLFFDTFCTIAWRASLPHLAALHVNIWQMAQEMESIDMFGLSKDQIAKTLQGNNND